MKTNVARAKINEKKFDTEANRLAGGYGMIPAKQNNESLLRRGILTCLLWEDIAYQPAKESVDNIADLIAKNDAEICYKIAIEAKTLQKLRHVPLYMAVIMAGLNTHKYLVSSLLDKVINRPDDISETLSLYWKNGRKPISNQLKKGLANAFGKFNAYQLGKYRGTDKQIALRDVVKLVHPKKSDLMKSLIEDNLPTPDTWEVALSTGKNKKETWERLINENKLGALAFLRNLRNMRKSLVSKQIIEHGFETINTKFLLPINYLAAYRNAPEWADMIEKLLIKSIDAQHKLSGKTVFVVDVSGSMSASVSKKSKYSRMDVASIMAVLASYYCEKVDIYVTAGYDHARKHNTMELHEVSGFKIIDRIIECRNNLGGGGIFTRQCLDYIRARNIGTTIIDRIIVFSDSQDCDNEKTLPDPFGKHNYIVDISSEKHGVNYDGVWSAEISGWSEYFLPYIMMLEGKNIEIEEENLP